MYESTSYWDKEKKKPRNKRVCIGKLDPDTKEFIPSKRLQKQETSEPSVPITASAEIVGPSLVLNAVTDELGLKKLMQLCFPDTHEEILTMAQYLVVDGKALSHCEGWCKNHAPEMAPSLTSQRISEILKSITFDARQTFLSKWMELILEDDYLCYDITSISSYAQSNEYVRYGYNRDNEDLPQINLAALFGQKGQLPVYYHKLPGNITDVSTLHNHLATFRALNIKSLNYVLDKGFYSKKNIDELFHTKNRSHIFMA